MSEKLCENKSKGRVIFITEYWIVCIMEDYEIVEIYKDQVPDEVFIGDFLIFEGKRISLQNSRHNHIAGNSERSPLLIRM